MLYPETQSDDRFPIAINKLNESYPLLKNALESLADEEQCESVLHACDELLTGVRDSWEGFSLDYTRVTGNAEFIEVNFYYKDSLCRIPTLIFRAAVAELLLHWKGPMLHENGQVRRQEQYKDSLRIGVWLYFDSDGTLRIKGNYTDGLRDGNWCTYYPNGQIRCNTEYNRGTIVGKWILWYENGQMKECRNHKGDGSVYEELWNKQGELLYWAEYANGRGAFQI